MPIYVYETVPEKAGQEPRRFEVRQSMTEPALARDPESGLPVRRVILGGLEIPRAPASGSRKPSCTTHGRSSCACCS